MAIIELKTLAEYLEKALDINTIKDYCSNGLQIEGKPEIAKIVTGVSANDALITAAIENNADALLTHHGFFWKGEEATITGLRYHRIAKLIKHDIALLAYHLPLDVHPIWGNNAQLATLLDFETPTYHSAMGTPNLLSSAFIKNALSPEEFQGFLSQKFQRNILWLPAKMKNKIQKIAWCTGAAQDFIYDAAVLNCDAFISGEVSERTTALAHELNCHYFACGHHATEMYGIQALGQHLAEKFGIQHQFINIDNPI